MPELELHDLTNDQTFAVPAEGLVFGREGGDADVQLADNSISRRQVRIMFKGGNWLFETMAVPQGKPMPRPRPLAQGETFRIGKTEFEVLNLGDEEQEQEAEPTPAMARGGKKPGPSQKQAPAQAKTMAGQAISGGEEEAAPKSIGAMFIAVPKGLAYYLVNVPKMLFNPFGTVATAIEEQPAEPMGRTELIGYALPSLLATALLGSIATGLALLIGPGHIFSFGAFVPIGPAIGALIGAIVTGFAFHPVTEWVMRKVFKGTTDARNRTNYFLQLMTLAILVAVPQAVGTLLASVPVPFIGLLGPLLMTLATLIFLYVVFQWWTKVFEVAKWARTVLLVLGALAVLGAALNLVTGLVANIRNLGSHSSSVGSTGNAEADAALAEAEKQTKEAQEQAEAAMEKGGEATAKARKMGEELRKKAEAEAAAAQVAAKTPEVKLAEEKKVEVRAPEKKEEKKVAAADPQPEPKAEPKPEPKAEPRVEPKADPAAPVAQTGGAYGAWAHKREGLEKLLEADPTRLEASKELQELYASYLEDCAKVEKKYRKDITNHADKTRLYEHLRDAELFHKTGATVDDLARRLGVK